MFFSVNYLFLPQFTSHFIVMLEVWLCKIFLKEKTIIHWNLQLSYFQLNQLYLFREYWRLIIFTFGKCFMYHFTVDKGTVSILWPLAFSYTFWSINVHILNRSPKPHPTPQPPQTINAYKSEMLNRWSFCRCDIHWHILFL